MGTPQPSSESAAALINGQVSKDTIEAEYTTPQKSTNSSHEVPPFPPNSKYDTKQPPTNSENNHDDTQSNENVILKANHDQSRALVDGSTLPMNPPSSIASSEEVVTEFNVDNLYDQLCELPNVFLNMLGIVWFFFIFEGVGVNQIKSFFIKIDRCLEQENHLVCPDRSNIWKWAEDVGSSDDVKVVIIGKDPSPLYDRDNTWKGIPLSCGTAFSVNPNYWEIVGNLQKYRSIKHIMKVAAPSADMESFDGNLLPWKKQGVLLTNSMLTTRARRDEDKDDRGMHYYFEWDFMVRLLLKKLGSASRAPTVFMPWGNTAKRLRQEADIDTKHKVIEACHPAWQEYHYLPTNCFCGRYCWLSHPGCETEPMNDFKLANEFLEQNGRGRIIWDCFGKKELLRRKAAHFLDKLDECNGNADENRGLEESNQNGAIAEKDACDEQEEGTVAEEGEKKTLNNENQNGTKRIMYDHDKEDDSESSPKKPKINLNEYKNNDTSRHEP